MISYVAGTSFFQAIREARSPVFKAGTSPIPHEEKPASSLLLEQTHLSLDRSYAAFLQMDQQKAGQPFPPLVFHLSRQGKPCSVIIERVSLDQARSLTEGVLREELQRYTAGLGHNAANHFILLAGTMDGKIEGMCLATLHMGWRGTGFMRCLRDLKSNRDKTTRIEDMGIAFLLARFLFMKQQGFWNPRAEILDYFDASLAASYRERSGLPPRATPCLELDGFTTEEGEALLQNPPFVFQRLEDAAQLF